MHRNVIAIAALAVTAMLGGCASVTTVSGPDGRPAYVVSCHTHIEHCYQAAGELCPAGYEALNQSASPVIVGTPHGIVGGARNSLLIQCKAPS